LALIGADRVRAVLSDYDAALDASGLADQSRRAYRSRVGGYLGWLASGDVGGSDFGGGDPLDDPATRDRAVKEYASLLVSERGARASTVNAVLTAIDHFYTHLRLGPVRAMRQESATAAPRILDEDEQARLLDSTTRHGSARDQAIVYMLFFTGVRVTELVSLDVRDVRVNPGTPRITVRAVGGRGREIPLDAQPLPMLRGWIRERRTWTGASDLPAFFLNRRGTRLSTRSVDDTVVRLGRQAGIPGGADEPQVTPHTLRHTFAARLLDSGVDVTTVNGLLGHRRLDTTRRYSTLAK